VNAAVDAAKEAYKSWRLVPAPKRAEILYRAAEILVASQRKYSKDMTREIGKVLGRNARRRAEAIRHDVIHGRRRPKTFGQTTPSNYRKFAMSVRQYFRRAIQNFRALRRRNQPPRLYASFAASTAAFTSASFEATKCPITSSVFAGCGSHTFCRSSIPPIPANKILVNARSRCRCHTAS